MCAGSVTLTGEQETLLVPLWSKATSTIIEDPTAAAILAALDYDFAALAIPEKTAVMLCIRALRLDEITRSFLAEHPAGPVLHLGCGLDARCRRVERNGAVWFDLDLPDVIELRRRFYDEGDGYHMLASAVTDLAWLDMVPRADAALVIAEGLTMYLRQEEVRDLFAALRDHFARVDLAFDAYSVMTARRAALHPSLAKTGATVRWGIDDPAELEQWGIGARVVEEWPFTRSEAIASLGLGTRLLFRVAGWFRAARRAHRIIRLQLDHGS